jgi:hypothetical protein
MNSYGTTFKKRKYGTRFSGTLMKLRGKKHNIIAPRNGRGERGGCDLLKARLISWVNPRFFFAGTALDSSSESELAMCSLNDHDLGGR